MSTEKIAVHCAHDELVQLSKLKAHPKNRNKHPAEQVERLAKIIKYQGWRYPVKVSKLSGYVTAGHGRIEAAKLLGEKTIPVNYQDYTDDAQEYADVQADNAIASWAELDLEGINTDLIELGDDFDSELLGLKELKIIIDENLEEKKEVSEHKQFLIVIECKDELEQCDIFNELQTREISCKLMS